MKVDSQRAGNGFSLVEALVIIAILAILTAMLLPLIARHRARPKRINCVNNLKQVGLAFRQWGLDHNDEYPMQVSVTNGGTMELVASGNVYPHFLVMSNELNTPKILNCPSDTRMPATVFDSRFSNTNISYFVGLDTEDTNPQMFLSGDRNLTNHLGPRSGLLTFTTNDIVGWTEQIHKHQGNVGLADGSVQQFDTPRLRQALIETEMVTNRLILP